jgi:hypothetical protein
MGDKMESENYRSYCARIGEPIELIGGELATLETITQVLEGGYSEQAVDLNGSFIALPESE